jgi:hypothetical protein
MRTKRWLIGLLGGVLLAGGAGIWWQRSAIWAWYCVQRLAGASEGSRDRWVQRAVALDARAIPGLLGCLQREDAQACANAQAALVQLVQTWGTPHPGREILAGRLADAFARCSGPGRTAALEVLTTLVQLEGEKAPPEEIVQAATRILSGAMQARERTARARALDLAHVLLAQAPTAPVLDACRDLTRRCLQDEDPQTRVRAVRLAARTDLKIVEYVAPLLHDPEARVRQAAMLAIAPAREVIRDDELLRSLHDPDPDVRRLCEAALRGRGLPEEQVRRGRLLTDARPAVRLQVLDGLCQAPDLEPGVWLRHLSHDPEPAVRAAAVRAAAEQTLVDLTDRIEQMARDDPSDTIRQLARYYLACRKSRERGRNRP